jgi:hypothetical protein
MIKGEMGMFKHKKRQYCRALYTMPPILYRILAHTCRDNKKKRVNKINRQGEKRKKKKRSETH